MSKFIETECGLFLNVNKIVVVDYMEDIEKDYNQVLLKFIATDTNAEKHLLLSGVCKKENLSSEYTTLSNKIKVMLDVNR